MSRISQATALQVNATPSQMLGMSPATFLRDYWQKRPLLIRDAFAGFSNPLAPNDLAGLACEESALSRIVLRSSARSATLDNALRSSLGGRPAGVLRASRLSGLRRNDGTKTSLDDRWTLRTGPFAESDFAKLPKSNWTLLVQDVDKWDTDVATLLDRFRFLPSWRVDDVMVSYAEDGGSVGAHVDQYDVFLLQGLGKRRWQIDAQDSGEKSGRFRVDDDERFAHRDDAELKLLRRFTPTHDWILEPGDMLYLPPGVPHHGVAIDACMTYSIGMRAPSMADLAGDFVDHLIDAMPENARYTDADLAPSNGDGEIDAAAIERVAQAMPWLRIASDGGDPKTSASMHHNQGRAGERCGRSSKVDSSTIEDQRRVGERLGCSANVDSSLLRTWFASFITRYRAAQTVAANPRALTDAAFARAVAENRSLQRHPWSRVAWLRDDNAAQLFVAGEAHACSLQLARLIGSRMRFAFGELPTNRRDRAVVRTLIDAGHFALARKPRRAS